MGEFFEIFSNGARHAREQRDFDKVHVVPARRGGTGPRPLDLDSGRLLLVRPGERVDGDGPVLRLATEADDARLSRLAVRAWLDASGMHHTDPTLDAVRDIAGRRTAGEQVLVLLEERRPVGVVAWTRAPDAAQTARISLLAVDPSQQRRGFGALLLDAVVAAATTADATRLLIETDDWMSAARALLHSSGFRRDGGHHALGLVADA